MKKGAEAEFDRTVEVKRLRVDEAFLGRLGTAAGES